MNSEAKNYIKNQLDHIYKNEEIGFFILNRYKKHGVHWDFVDSEIKIMEFNKEHTFIEKIGDVVLEGNGNREKVEAYIKKVQQKGEYISHQILWHTHSLKETLSLYAKHNTENKEVPNLDKRIYTKVELKEVCENANKINFEDHSKASKRTTNFAAEK